jgi:hypothetical protein
VYDSDDGEHDQRTREHFSFFGCFGIVMGSKVSVRTKLTGRFYTQIGGMNASTKRRGRIYYTQEQSSTIAFNMSILNWRY